MYHVCYSFFWYPTRVTYRTKQWQQIKNFVILDSVLVIIVVQCHSRLSLFENRILEREISQNCHISWDALPVYRYLNSASLIEGQEYIYYILRKQGWCYTIIQAYNSIDFWCLYPNHRQQLSYTVSTVKQHVYTLGRKIRSGAVITRSNITWYCIYYCSAEAEYKPEFEYTKTPHTMPHRANYGVCLLWGFWIKLKRRYNGMALFIARSNHTIRDL